MSFSSGTYSLPGPALNTGDTVSATENNTFRNDVATAFNLTWLRNGTAAATADIPMGGFSFTNCAAVGSAGSLLLKTNGGTTAVTIDTAQNVGVGVTPSAWFSVYKAFQLGSYGAAIAGQTNAQALSLWNNAYPNASNVDTYTTTNAANKFRMAGGAFEFYNAASGTAGNAISFTQAMTLDASGNLGVGTSSPDGKLVVLGSAGSNPYSHFKDSSGADFFIQAVGNSDCRTGTASNHPWLMFTNGSERARIDSSGNLLVGVTNTNPISNNTLGMAFLPSSGQAIVQSSTSGAWQMGINAASGTHFQFYTRPSTIYVAGAISSSSSTTTYGTSSDYRLKNITGDLSNYKERLLSLKPKQGSWKVDDTEFRGFLAHEFAETYPNSVVGEKDAKDEQGNPKYQIMQAGSAEVIADLVAMIQEQQALITTLTERITALENK